MTEDMPLQPAPTIANIAILVSRGYRVGEMGFTALTEDGHQFVTITDAGLIERMGGFREGPEHETEEAAVSALLLHIEDYKLKTPGGLIRWRRMPEVMKNPDTGLWRAGCRLVISDDPAAHLGRDHRRHLASMFANAILTMMLAWAMTASGHGWTSFVFGVWMIYSCWRFEVAREAFIGPAAPDLPKPW